MDDLVAGMFTFGLVLGLVGASLKGVFIIALIYYACKGLKRLHKWAYTKETEEGTLCTTQLVQ